MNILQSGWKTASLGAISERIDYGYTGTTSESQSGPKYLRITDIQEGTVEWDKVPFCDASQSDIEQYRLNQGDIVFVRTGATTGKSYHISDCPNDTVFASYLIRVRPGRSINSRFLSHYFNTPHYWDQIKKHAKGAGQPGVNATSLKCLTIPLPPLPEQKRIADILDKADAIRRKRREASVELESFLHGVFTNLFGHPDANPHKWPIRHFSEVCDTRLGKMLDAKQQTGHHNRPYMRNLNVQWGHIDLSQVYKMDFNESDRKEFRLKYGDVLICEGGAGVGQTAIWRNELEECYFQKSLHRARPNQGLATPEYIAFLMWILMNGSSLRRSISSATIPHLTGEKLKEVKIPVPPYELQQKFSSICLRLSESREKAEQSLKYTTALFESLVQNAFSGALR